ncbi:penicillin-binding protein, putative [Metarhizium acridum CQMa 102]|uniref:Penicillin-binding protein, putative n=1 Tax=Metarhizium acridum (strain CQMa 102) TaxID=655827 RepID=E9ECF7_METAQ|nr:penicillin-binding protein, putative [Metarhizium acridum CQMa 102]EFY86410.1 penicillin-binding protein, putative [Metarhizium acridum CQMa 102]
MKPLVLALTLFLHAAAGAKLQPPPTRGVPNGHYGGDAVAFANETFEQFILAQMNEWHVPGLAMAATEGNKTWAKGFGYATLGSEPVTPSTLFYCGSMTKSLTAAALSILVDERKNGSNMQWTTPISSILKDDFVLSDAWATGHITLEDALCHRTGYPRHDFSGPFGNSSVDMIRKFRHLPMSQEPRVKWQYSNMMYGTLGYVVERISGTRLADFFRDRLWHPMGMFNTFLHPGDALAGGCRLAHAYYYNNDTQQFGELPWNDEGSVAAAGMAISSVLDWSRYLRHMISESGPIPKAGHAALKAPHMVSEQDKRIYSGTEFYGLGWGSNMIQNEAVWYHSGRVSGMLSYMAFIPARKFGFVIMLNTESVAALDSIFSTTLFNYFEVASSNRYDIKQGWYDLLRDLDYGLRNCSARLYPGTGAEALPSGIVLDDLVGSYYNDGYGYANVTLRCDDWKPANGSPSVLSLTSDGCRVVIPRSELFGKNVSFQLQYVSGDQWLAWFFVDDYKTVTRPTGCYRVQIVLGPDGKPDMLGLDIRMEGDDLPLTWFKRA